MWYPFRPRPPLVALVRLEGVIAARAGPFAGLNAAGVNPILERAFGLKRLKAVFLAINSPGGSPVQSSLIARRIRQLAEEKKVPVIAVAEDAAASGGYWIACAADEIIADPASILGSVGVISAGFGFQEAIGRLGIERRVRTAGTQKSLNDPFRPQAPEDTARLEELLVQLHVEFKDWVRSRRGAQLKAPEDELFTGRFWIGRRALELGLCDGLGDAQGEARRRFGDKVRVVTVGARRRRFPMSLLPGAGAMVDAGRLAAGALEAAEERAAWGRLGL
ncbi:S49 family peptidase [Roseococcus sp. SYP-B2431]|uniref:S49 family peptidase n=1 Tax=Roseococcus sp. SYP-B2431 TaxID=2496640 RepID=UPI00103E0C96|nr:S49 family peptidase [Roseococcus sp. SYP-B2431]TCH97847.1 S49 family peptidase [Roseococcus sp. SYP-B2431]